MPVSMIRLMQLHHQCGRVLIVQREVTHEAHHLFPFIKYNGFKATCVETPIFLTNNSNIKYHVNNSSYLVQTVLGR